MGRNLTAESTSQSPRLDLVDRKTIIKHACNLYWENSYLWVFIRDICGVGSNSARQICKECGWDPDHHTKR